MKGIAKGLGCEREQEARYRWRPNIMTIKRILPPLHLLGLCIVAQVALRLLWPIAVVFPFPVNYIGLLPLAGGIVIAAKGLQALRAAKTEFHPFAQPGKLVTAGIFRRTRNPIYLGMALMLLGTWVLNRCIAGVIVVPLFILVADRWYIRSEERMLHKQFGGAFGEYKKKTRRWI